MEVGKKRKVILKKNKNKQKKRKLEKKSEKKHEKKEECTLDYCRNPKCAFGCGETVIPSHNLDVCIIITCY